MATALWFVAFAVSAAFWGPLGRHHRHDVVWTCLAGGVLGLLGYALMRRHRAMGRTV